MNHRTNFRSLLARIALPVMVIAISAVAFAQTSHEPERAAATESRDAATQSPDVEPRPVLPADASWATPLLWVILLLFFGGAMIIGPIVRSEMPEEIPDSHSHDEHEVGDRHHSH